MPSERWVVIRGDGVTYRHGTRAPLQHAEPVEVEGGPEVAGQVARLFLEAREGDDLMLVSGWLAVRWFSSSPPTWEGPAYLFEWQAPSDGALSVEAAGSDPEAWPFPPLG